MPAPKRITPRLTLSVAQGNAIQVGGLLGATALACYTGREEAHGTRTMVASRLLAYFSEHAFSHWLVGRALGICFTGYGLHGTSHPQHYPPGVRWVFSRLPLLSARTDPSSLKESTPAARGDVLSRDCCDRDSERRDPGLRLAARCSASAGLFRRREPVECSAASQRITAPRW